MRQYVSTTKSFSIELGSCIDIKVPNLLICLVPPFRKPLTGEQIGGELSQEVLQGMFVIITISAAQSLPKLRSILIVILIATCSAACLTCTFQGLPLTPHPLCHFNSSFTWILRAPSPTLPVPLPAGYCGHRFRHDHAPISHGRRHPSDARSDLPFRPRERSTGAHDSADLK